VSRLEAIGHLVSTVKYDSADQRSAHSASATTQAFAAEPPLNGYHQTSRQTEPIIYDRFVCVLFFIEPFP
jgi:hypothetical protein